MNVLKISKQVVITALSKWESESIKDMRGSHGNQPILSEVKRTAVIQHIKKFPTYVSHYKRETSSALYLDPQLNISIMYRLFLAEWFKGHDENSTDENEKAPSKSF